MEPRSASRPERLTVALDPEGLSPSARQRLAAEEDAHVERLDGRGGDAQLEAPVEALRHWATDEPDLLHLLDAWTAATAPPGRAVMVGVLNVTPDSFSDGGQFLDPARAIEHAHALRGAGAEWIDVGGESTRPGAAPVDPAEEKRRVLDVIAVLASEDLRVSIDTRRAEVARAALDCGARMVNDVSGGADPGMFPLVAERSVPFVLMHAQGDPETMQAAPRYEDPVAEVAAFLRDRGASAIEAGVDPEQLLLDPGIGFGKRVEHNLALLRRLPELRSLGRPLYLGVSRKSFIGHLTGAERPEDWRSEKREDVPEHRLGGTAAALTACVLGGAEWLRVHDVGVMDEARIVAEALRGSGQSG